MYTSKLHTLRLLAVMQEHSYSDVPSSSVLIVTIAEIGPVPILVAAEILMMNSVNL